MILVNDLRPGYTFQQDGEIYQAMDVSRNKTARGQMNIKVKVRNLRSNNITELAYTGGDKVEPAMIEKRTMQYLYDSGEALVFMDVSTYEQLEIRKENLKWEINFLKENENCTITMFKTEIIGVILPDKVALRVVETEPAVRGDTATSAMKNATVETGFQVKVPLFINTDEIIMVNTDDGKYSGRA